MGWRMAAPAVVPAVTTAPPWATAAPETCWPAAGPRVGAGCQAAPLADVYAARAGPDWPLITAPSGPPVTRVAVKPAGAVAAGAVTGAAKGQRVPAGERVT